MTVYLTPTNDAASSLDACGKPLETIIYAAIIALASDPNFQPTTTAMRHRIEEAHATIRTSVNDTIYQALERARKHTDVPPVGCYMCDGTGRVDAVRAEVDPTPYPIQLWAEARPAYCDCEAGRWAQHMDEKGPR